MSKAVVIHKTGGREVLTIEDREVGMPGPGQLRIRNTHIGLNYIDVYFREGLYGTDTPFVPAQRARAISPISVRA